MKIALVLLLAYGIGGIPFGYLLTRAAGRGDIRKLGSGNPGTTNVIREVGRGWGSAVLILDLLKGVAAVLLAASLGTQEWLPLVAGLSAIAGHSFTPFLSFRGGKGVATSGGVFLTLAPLALGLTLVVFFLVLLSVRMVSAASLSAALALPLFVALVDGWMGTLFWLALFVAALVWYRHRSNIGRIIHGNEPRFKLGRTED